MTTFLRLKENQEEIPTNFLRIKYIIKIPKKAEYNFPVFDFPSDILGAHDDNPGYSRVNNYTCYNRQQGIIFELTDNIGIY